MVCALSALVRLSVNVPAPHLVVVIKVDPSSQTTDNSPPLLGVCHDDLATSAVVFGDTNLLNSLATAHAKLFLELVVDDLLDGHT